MPGLRFLTGAPLSVLFGGWAAKMAMVAIYPRLGAAYLHWLELPRRRKKQPPRIVDVFDLLTYRERYEDLLARSGRDALTGALDRGRLEHLGRKRVEEAALAGRPLSLFIIDIDNFKSFNDRFGHASGDIVLLRIARIMIATVGPKMPCSAMAARSSWWSPTICRVPRRLRSANASAATSPGTWTPTPRSSP